MKILRKTATVAAAVVVFALALPAPAAVVNLGMGWQASWDDSLDGLVDVINSGEVGDTLFIQKFCDFRQGPVNEVIPPILIQFQQIAPSAAAHIVIDDEMLTNSTGVTWTDFHIELVNLSGGAVFDPVKTAASGGTGPIGWTVEPFALAVFSSNLKKLDIWGGEVPSGTIWWPGDGASDGQLWIDLKPGPNNSCSFVLVEQPTTTGIPEPATLCLLALGGLALLKRKRKS
jgi:hypothetical protein